jgi:hypothetical protein
MITRTNNNKIKMKVNLHKAHYYYIFSKKVSLFKIKYNFIIIIFKVII